MLLGDSKNTGTYEAFLQNPVWQEVLTWLKTVAPTLPEGEHEIHGRDIYAPISVVETKSREECAFEAHQQYIDVHYCLEGGERIEWIPVDQLTPSMEFDKEKDYCLYKTPAQAANLIMTPGTFAIFFPADAHMPKISDGQNKSIKKVVVKIKTSALQ